MHEESSSFSTAGVTTVTTIPDDGIATGPSRSTSASKPNRGKRTPPMPATLATTKAKLERSVERVEAALTGLMEAADKLSKGTPEPMRDVAKLQRQYTAHYRDGTLLASHRDGLRQQEQRVEGYKVMDYVGRRRRRWPEHGRGQAGHAGGQVRARGAGRLAGSPLTFTLANQTPPSCQYPNSRI